MTTQRRQWILRITCTIVLLLMLLFIKRLGSKDDASTTITDAPYAGHTEMDTLLQK